MCAAGTSIWIVQKYLDGFFPVGPIKDMCSILLCLLSALLSAVKRQLCLTHLQDRNRLRKHDLAPNALPCQERHLVLNSEQLFERLEREPYAVHDLIALADVAKDDGELTSGERREGASLVGHVRHFNDGPAKERLGEDISEHGPDRACGRVCKQPTYTDGGVRHQPGASSTIA